MHIYPHALRMGEGREIGIQAILEMREEGKGGGRKQKGMYDKYSEEGRQLVLTSLATPADRAPYQPQTYTHCV
jgi:hypothetical protein